MKKIDNDLGGTTPLNIILKFPTKDNSIKDDDEFLNGMKIMIVMKINLNIGLQEIKWINFKVHDYLDSFAEVGKVLSFGSILRVAEDLNKKELQSLEIAVLYSKIPAEIKREIVSPYISVEKDKTKSV